MSFPRRTLSAAALGVSAVLLLAGCSGDAKNAALGESQVVTPRTSNSATNGKLQITILSAEKAAASTMSQKMVEKYGSGTVYYVTYRVKKTEGTYDPKDTYSLSAYNWGAGASGGADLKTLNVIGSTPDACKDFSSENAKTLSEGGTVEACQIFVADAAGAVLDTVIYGQPSISRKGSDKGWRWSIPA